LHSALGFFGALNARGFPTAQALRECAREDVMAGLSGTVPLSPGG
jgi:hypothetical protein